MTEYAVVVLVALIASGLTLFSGFGLGSLLLPAFAFFFPLEIAIAATAVVHLANNGFKLLLIGRWASKDVVIRFGVPAVAAAIGGAFLMVLLSKQRGLITTWDLGGRACEITLIGLTIGLLIVAFSIVELVPKLKGVQFSKKALPIGGALSGFFGGLSGHQGALRSAFLIRAGLDKNQYVGTASVCSAMVDLVRIVVYGLGMGFFTKNYGGVVGDAWGLVAAACGAAFVGSFFGSKLVKKVTLEAVQVIVAVMLLISALAIAGGII